MAEDSVSFLPALSGQPIVSTRKGVIHHSVSGHFAYRQGKWKLLLSRASGGWSSPTERGAQRLTLYGSASDQDPGWDTNKLTPIGSIDTRGNPGALFQAASLRAAEGESFGQFRWIVWQVAPVSSKSGGEHTAFQELQVE